MNLFQIKSYMKLQGKKRWSKEALLSLKRLDPARYLSSFPLTLMTASTKTYKRSILNTVSNPLI